jgi:hypothetical protein
MQNSPSNGMNEMMHLGMPNSFDLDTDLSNWDGLFPALNQKAMDVDDYEREGFNQYLNFSDADDNKGPGF